MAKIYLAFELNNQETFETERHRAVFFHPNDMNKVFYVMEMTDIEMLVRQVKVRFPDNDLVLLEDGFMDAKVIHRGRWGIKTVLNLYGSKS